MGTWYVDGNIFMKSGVFLIGRLVSQSRLHRPQDRERADLN